MPGIAGVLGDRNLGIGDGNNSVTVKEKVHVEGRIINRISQPGEGLDKTGIRPKYVTGYLKHNAVFAVGCNLPFGFKNDISVQYKKRMEREGYFLLNAILYREVELVKGTARYFIRLDSICNAGYSDQADLRMPGFSIFGGMHIRF